MVKNCRTDRLSGGRSAVSSRPDIKKLREVTEQFSLGNVVGSVPPERCACGGGQVMTACVWQQCVHRICGQMMPLASVRYATAA